jgi:hypothetical protein
MVWWHDAPDGRELKIALDGDEWLVVVEGDDRPYRASELRRALAEGTGHQVAAPWLTALADQIEAAAARLTP